MDNFLDLAKRRRSVRKYLPDEIAPDVLVRILEAGRVAPSGNNSQPWRFIVVKDQNVKKRLYDVAGKQKWILEAPVTIAVIGDIEVKKSKHSYAGDGDQTVKPDLVTLLLKTVRDATIAADHIVMAAEDEGLGTCWIALYEQGDIRPVLGVPENCYVVAIITVGRAAELPKPRSRFHLREIVFEDKYGKSFPLSEEVAGRS